MVTRWRGRSVLSHFVELFPRWLSGKDSAYQSMQETQETWVWSLGGEDSLEEEMATHSSILALRIPWRGAWWDIVHGVTKGWAGLSRWGHWGDEHGVATLSPCEHTLETLIPFLGLQYSTEMCACELHHVPLFATPWTVCSPPGSSVYGIFMQGMKFSCRPGDSLPLSRQGSPESLIPSPTLGHGGGYF